MMRSNLGIRLSGPPLGRRPKHVDAAQRREDQSAKNRRGEIGREFAFIKGTLGLDLELNRTAETITVRVDVAVVMANLKQLLLTFTRPVSLMTVLDGEKFRIDSKSTLIQ